jgi:hypothetical protein
VRIYELLRRKGFAVITARPNATVLEVRECTDSQDPDCREAVVLVDEGPDEGVDRVVPIPYGPGVPELGHGHQLGLATLCWCRYVCPVIHEREAIT